ncbi:dedicator of cytokinesis protein 1-like, partial [Centruroides sculpturatus]|uniref:dedicator of cytokinesis protein 1-like n=1 Tax=Centruroides sculpturatus TaxID=218467 RepID=UPI000C6CF83A
MNEYRSVIYYHEDKPKWMETFKVAIPIDEFYNAHLRFTFKHRSSNEAKDKTEKPFAISFAKLMQENGTTLKDEIHELLVYKIDHKKFDENDAHYLSLPTTKMELELFQQLHGNTNNNPSRLSVLSYPSGLILNLKDSFSISTLVCSTKLTQN